MTEAFNPGFPVHVYEAGMELPTEGTYFLVAGNGQWLHKDTGIVKGFVPVDGIGVLEELDAHVYVECTLPKLPLRHVWRIKEFFRQVVEKYRAESSTTLYYRKSDQTFRIHVPQQRVSHGGVNYNRVGLTHLEEMEDYLRIGTIHSHCDFNAFHSGTDIHDEEDFDGLHCTFGHNDKDTFTISATVVMNGVRRKVNPVDVLEGIVPVDETRDPLDRGDHFYNIIPVSEETKEDWSQDLGEWMSQVRGSEWGKRGFWKWGQPEEITQGDKVEWAGEMKTVSFRNVCGDGPFEVVSVEKGQVTIETNVGKARFSEKLLRKV